MFEKKVRRFRCVQEVPGTHSLVFPFLHFRWVQEGPGTHSFGFTFVSW